MKRELVIVIDFGGQYNQLVARRVRECNVYCEIYSYKTDLEKIKAMNPKGIILTGGPNSCYEADSPTYQKELFELGIPVLGLCYGAQLMMHVLGGKVEKADVSEYGKTELLIDKKDSRIFKNVSDKTICWMSHTDYISQTAPGFEIAAHTADCPVATAQNEEKKLYAIQFHPEVLHTVEGKTMLSNFVLGVCECAGDWKMDAFVEHTIKEIREKVGDGKVLLALSGGVDSSVAAGLLSRAIGKQLTCVFVDHGLLRKDEGDEVEGVFGPNGQFDLNFIRVNAQQRYYDKLAGVTEPEAKRKIIGEEFIRIFEEEAKKIGAVDFLAQGTIYPDVVESGLGGESAVIKSHHNVGGLPDFVDFKEIIEPLRDLFKDEVRKAGLELGIPERLVFRQPFPGPGLGIRIIGEVTEEKVRIVQDADYIYREEVDKAAADYKKEHGEDPSWMPNQYFAALTNMRSVGVMGDERTYDYAVAVRAVRTVDFMTAEAAEIPFEVLQTVPGTAGGDRIRRRTMERADGRVGQSVDADEPDALFRSDGRRADFGTAPRIDGGPDSPSADAGTSARPAARRQDQASASRRAPVALLRRESPAVKAGQRHRFRHADDRDGRHDDRYRPARNGRLAATGISAKPVLHTDKPSGKEY